MKTQIGNFTPSFESMDRAVHYWMKHGRPDLNAADQVEQFILHHKSHGKRMADWDMAWQTWYRYAIKFNKPPREQVGKSANLTHHASKPYRAPDEPRYGRPRSVAEILNHHGHTAAARAWRTE